MMQSKSKPIISVMIVNASMLLFPELLVEMK
jgi:hypothetical protein